MYNKILNVTRPVGVRKNRWGNGRLQHMDGEMLPTERTSLSESVMIRNLLRFTHLFFTFDLGLYILPPHSHLVRIFCRSISSSLPSDAHETGARKTMARGLSGWIRL